MAENKPTNEVDISRKRAKGTEQTVGTVTKPLTTKAVRISAHEDER